MQAEIFAIGTELLMGELMDANSAWLAARLPALGIVLPKEAKLIEDYGQRIFRNPGFLRSMTPEEKLLREQPA